MSLKSGMVAKCLSLDFIHLQVMMIRHYLEVNETAESFKAYTSKSTYDFFFGENH